MNEPTPNVNESSLNSDLRTDSVKRMLAKSWTRQIMNSWHAEKQGLPLPMALAKLQDRMVDEIEKALIEREQNYQQTVGKACEEAVGYILARIREEEPVRNLLGVGTESFTRLTKAASELWGKPQAEVCEEFIPGSSEIHAPDDSSSDDGAD